MDGKLIDRSPREQSGWEKTARYLVSWMNIIDFVSIVPFFIHMGLDSVRPSLLLIHPPTHLPTHLFYLQNTHPPTHPPTYLPTPTEQH